MNLLNRLFKLEEHSTSVYTEARAGMATFLTMAYIVFVQPAVLGAAGMPREAVFWATCLSSAFASLMMGLYANLPVALAPGMGGNFFFAFAVAPMVINGTKLGWQGALGVVLMSGLLFLLITVTGLREKVLDAIPRDMRWAIAAGIGLFILFIGLEHSGIVVAKPGTYVARGDFTASPVLVAMTGLITTAALMAWRIKGAVLIGILAALVMALPLGIVTYNGVMDFPRPDMSAFLAASVTPFWTSADFWILVFVFLVMDMFDTLGTLVGVAERAGLVDDQGRIPRVEKAFLSDAIGTVMGALIGTSTVTSYIESTAGVEEGGRTGLTSVFVALFFLLALFFSPLVAMIGTGYLSGNVTLYPVTAGALMVVGAVMMSAVARIDWNDWETAFPAAMTVAAIPLTFNIADGIGIGILSLVMVKLLRLKYREVSPLLYGVALIFALRFWIG